MRDLALRRDQASMGDYAPSQMAQLSKPEKLSTPFRRPVSSESKLFPGREGYASAKHAPRASQLRLSEAMLSLHLAEES
jgi:hypothetical protein